MSPERLSIASVRARGTNMQDQRELGGAAGQGLPLCAFLSDLPEQGGGVSLRQVSKDSGAPGRQSGDAVEWARLRCALPPPAGEARTSGGSCEGLSTSTARGPDPGNTAAPGGSLKSFKNPQPALNNSVSLLSSRRGPQPLSRGEPLLPKRSMVLASLTRVE